MAEIMKYDDFKEHGSENAVKVCIFKYHNVRKLSYIDDIVHVQLVMLARRISVFSCFDLHVHVYRITSQPN